MLQRLNKALTPRVQPNDDDLDESFTTEKKALDRKFREQKRNLNNQEAARIEQDQIQLNLDEKNLKKRGKSNHNWELNALKLNFAEDQKVKEQKFEDSVENLKQRYYEDLEKLCMNYNLNFESHVESNMKLNIKPELVNIDDQSPGDQNVGNLSPRKYDLVKRWAEDTSQNMENNAIDVSKEGPDMPYSIEPKTISHNFPVLHATETRNGLDEIDTGGAKTRVPLIPVGKDSKCGSQKGRNGNHSPGSSSELLAPSNVIKKRPISGITKNDQSKLQTYYTPISPRNVSKIHDNSFSKDVQNFNSWLDSLRSPSNPSMPKISRPKAENFVERFDLPNGESEGQNEPLPQNVIDAIFARLDTNSSNNRNRNRKQIIRPNKRPSREKENSAPVQPQTPSNLRKWKSAPMDVNEVIPSVEETPMEQFPSLEASSQENLWLASPEGNFNPQFPVGKNNTSIRNPVRNSGFRNSAYKPLPPVPGPVEDENYMNLADLTLLQPMNEYKVGYRDRLDFNPDIPPSIPSRSPKLDEFNRMNDLFHSSGPPQHFQEMSVDEPGSKPMKWNPMKNSYSRDDPKISVPWNARSMDHLDDLVDPTTLNRR